MAQTDADSSALQYEQIPPEQKRKILESQPFRLTRIQTNQQNCRTNPNIIEKLLESIYTPQTTTVYKLYQNIAFQKLQAINLFKKVTANLKKDNDYLVQEDYVPLYLDFDFEEKSRELIAKTTISEEGGGLEIRGSLLNIFGNRENLSASYFGNTRLSKIMRCELSRPINPLELDSSILSLEGFQDSFSRKNTGFEEVSRGIAAKCYLDNRNTFSYEFSWRDLNFVPSASMEVRSSAGDSVKSSIKWRHFNDHRDSRLTPNQGLAYQVTTELAGLGGNVKFFKTDAAIEYYQPLPVSGWVARGYLRGGNMIPWGGDRIRVNDKLIEPNLRGFSKGLGPTSSKGEMLGGNLLLSGGLDIYSPIVFSASQLHIRGHAFLNFGNLVSTTGLGVGESMSRLLDKNLTRVSIGAGLVLENPALGRLEFDYSIPIQSMAGDKASRGMQFGFGIRLM